ncbi:MAG: nucleotidyltransferase family protein [Phycisphaerales bacterium]
MQLHGIHIPERPVQAICARYGALRLSLFGSILRDDFGPHSDVDVLVEFEPGGGPGLFGFAGMQSELSECFGRSVHLHTPSMLGPTFREAVQREARVVRHAA